MLFRSWQIDLIEDGGSVQQATVLFNPDSGETRAMRTKEDAADYRYFPDPDLPPLVIDPEWVAQVRATLPELPRALAERLVREHGLPDYDATTLTQSPAMAAYFEATVRAGAPAKAASNWIMGEVLRLMKERGVGIEAIPVSPHQLAGLIAIVEQGTISSTVAKDVFADMCQSRSEERRVGKECRL